MKKLLLIIAFFLLTPSVHAAQALEAGQVGGLAAGVEQYTPVSVLGAQSSQTLSMGIMPFAGVLGNAYMHLVLAPGVGASYQFMLMLNNASTSATCTIANTTTGCVIPNSGINFKPGDSLTIASVPSNTPTVSAFASGIAMYPSVPGNIVVYGKASGNNSTTVEQYSIISQNANSTPNALEASSTEVLPVSGVLDSLYEVLNNTPGGATSYVTTLKQNTATTTLSATISGANTTGNDTTHSVSITAGDIFDWAVVPVSTPLARTPGMAMRFRPTDPTISTIWIGSSFTASDGSSGVNRYIPISGDRSTTGVQNAFQAITPLEMVVRNIYATSTAPGVGNSRTFTFQVNGTNTTLSCTMTGTQDHCSGTGNVYIHPGDLIGTLDFGTGASLVLGLPQVSYAASDPHGLISLPYGPGSSVVNELVVGGGGGGGGATASANGGSGGGGSGAVILTTALVSSQAYTITIGTGGNGGNTSGTPGTSGGDSLALGTTATGGGGGGGTNNGNEAGIAGGSGGGGAANGFGNAGTGGSGTTGGKNGGNGALASGGLTDGGGGGGGANAIGNNGVGTGTGGNGGAGIASTISGASVTYGGGGGGGGTSAGGSGGSGGGGAGKNAATGGTGTANTGSGGGGTGTTGIGFSGGPGGSGIVIISAPLGIITSATGGSHTTTATNDIWTFTSSGTWTPVVNGGSVLTIKGIVSIQ